MMSDRSGPPHKERLCRAVRWISEQGECSLEIIERAARRFDLSPLDEDFLLRHFREHKGPGRPAP
jgi:hypothetical protein